MTTRDDSAHPQGETRAERRRRLAQGHSPQPVVPEQGQSPYPPGTSVPYPASVDAPDTVSSYPPAAPEYLPPSYEPLGYPAPPFQGPYDPHPYGVHAYPDIEDAVVEEYVEPPAHLPHLPPTVTTPVVDEPPVASAPASPPPHEPRRAMESRLGDGARLAAAGQDPGVSRSAAAASPSSPSTPSSAEPSSPAGLADSADPATAAAALQLLAAQAAAARLAGEQPALGAAPSRPAASSARPDATDPRERAAREQRAAERIAADKVAAARMAAVRAAAAQKVASAAATGAGRHDEASVPSSEPVRPSSSPKPVGAVGGGAARTGSSTDAGAPAAGSMSPATVSSAGGRGQGRTTTPRWARIVFPLAAVVVLAAGAAVMTPQILSVVQPSGAPSSATSVTQAPTSAESSPAGASGTAPAGGASGSLAAGMACDPAQWSGQVKDTAAAAEFTAEGVAQAFCLTAGTVRDIGFTELAVRRDKDKPYTVGDFATVRTYLSPSLVAQWDRDVADLVRTQDVNSAAAQRISALTRLAWDNSRLTFDPAASGRSSNFAVGQPVTWTAEGPDGKKRLGLGFETGIVTHMLDGGRKVDQILKRTYRIAVVKGNPSRPWLIDAYQVTSQTAALSTVSMSPSAPGTPGAPIVPSSPAVSGNIPTPVVPPAR
ncbi:hypothetical protein KEM60_00140 [Austwickia sp. TVS 96-490-7B]|uniref:hypothetical protein n=1 Tax=Austwickia sp. TVS 96-490-7B TaxID=2830843 RepID=UPI001C58DB2F|nr:hypothetical protein [Austwickia sp. TVS 96-490-7B]MBW3083957.1 hypothetical protein [Austwickia sp. TVS 96-490-7B]